MNWWRGNTTWGRSARFRFDETDPRVLRKWCSLLSRMELISWWLSVLLTVVIFALATRFLMLESFENIIFFDGTERLCVMEGASGTIKAIEE